MLDDRFRCITATHRNAATVRQGPPAVPNEGLRSGRGRRRFHEFQVQSEYGHPSNRIQSHAVQVFRLLKVSKPHNTTYIPAPAASACVE